ncbi:MAG: hypothetical protein HUU02_10625 [Bacteroidetes bacterium]|nr:hypothetical protein [Bacteroidota bacterium]
MKKYFLLLILYTSSFAQGEFFKNGESGLVIGRVYGFNRVETLYGTGFGVSIFGRVDVAMVALDLEPVFGGLTSYSITGHLMKQGSDSLMQYPFSLAFSMSQASRYRSYSLYPYITLPISEYFACMFQAGVAMTSVLGGSGTDGPQIPSFVTGISFQGSVHDRFHIILESGANIGKGYPSFGLSALVRMKLF